MRGSPAHQAQELLEEPGARGHRERSATLNDGVVDIGGNPQVQSGAELDRPQDSHGVFLETGDRLTDRPNDASLDVGHSIDPVEHLALFNVVEETVDREVTALGVLVGHTENVV